MNECIICNGSESSNDYSLIFYKQHFYKQRQAEIGKKLSKCLRLNFCYLKIIYILHPGCHPKKLGQILKR